MGYGSRSYGKPGLATGPVVVETRVMGQTGNKANRDIELTRPDQNWQDKTWTYQASGQAHDDRHHFYQLLYHVIDSYIMDNDSLANDPNYGNRRAITWIPYLTWRPYLTLRRSLAPTSTR